MWQTDTILARFFLIISMLVSGPVHAQYIDIERFEYLGTRDGLSQNFVLSMYCDHMGFMWFGTFNGLNRYDGYNFEIYKSEPGKSNVLSHNRIISIWEDERLFLWIKTNDGYYHYLNRKDDKFYTFPDYLNSSEEKNSIITCKYQFSKDEIWLGSDKAGAYLLTYDSLHNRYTSRQFISRGIGAITNNHVNFILSDNSENIWIGTQNGLNQLSHKEWISSEAGFQHYFVDVGFSCYTFANREVWMGTRQNGIIIYDPDHRKFISPPESLSVFRAKEITALHTGRYGHIIIGTATDAMYIYEPVEQKIVHFDLHGKQVKFLYEDYLGNIWVNTENFGVTIIDPVSGTEKYFVLTQEEIQPLVDDERQFFYEDRRKNLWIGLHGGGLALYDRDREDFIFFRNDPKDPKTISSNFVHCIAEDRSGMLWVGTGQFNGGINKIIPGNPSFRQIIPAPVIHDISDNVVRCTFEDRNGYVWLATKSGKIYIYDSFFTLAVVLDNLPLVDKELPGYNVYSIMQDQEGYIWLGSKGGGLSVSTKPVGGHPDDYQKLTFHAYRHNPLNSNSLSSDMIYSVIQDQHKRVWIGTYGGGVNLVASRNPAELICRRINKTNSNLSSDDVRQIFEDSNGDIWIASNFGLNLLMETSSDSALFRVFNYDPLNNSGLSYNDVIHLFEDSGKRLWIGTYGGGVNLLQKIDDTQVHFKHFNQVSGLSNDAVFGILEDDDEFLWFSTEKGISRFDPLEEKFEIFNEHDGLISTNFNENTCFKTQNGQLIFGSMNGALLISPRKISNKSHFSPPLVLTKFQLFNKDIDIHAEDSPIKTTIETTDNITLKYWQSSFSIEYSALNYFDPGKNEYSFILQNFDESWNNVKNQRKATYTNLPPGHYVFQVKATDSEGLWSDDTIKSLNINILPPWWKTKLAYVIYFMTFVLIGESGRRIFTKYHRLRNDLRVERKVSDIKLKFFTNISHEIRTPLTLILGPLEDIRNRENLPGVFRKSVDIMYRNGNRMLRLINQLLDFRKIQNNKMKIRVKKVDLPEFIGSICSNFEYLAFQKNIQFNCDVGEVAQEVWIDTSKIDSVLFNILSNAFKFTPSGKSVTVSLNVNRELEYADVSVGDEGPGIPDEKINLLFDRYTSLSTDSKYLSSTGIGLSLSKELIEMHSGKILVNSKIGEGSEFILRLPLGNKHFKPEEIEIREVQQVDTGRYEIDIDLDSEPADIAPKDVTAHSPTILVVEDNPEVRSYIVDALSSFYNVVDAENGEDGLTITCAIHPDIIITDIMMPVMDGIEMTRKIKENFDTSHIPVVMLTAKSNLDDQIEGIDSGAEAYILKPFNAKFLLTVVRNLIKQRIKILEKYSRKESVKPGEIKITSRDEKFLKKIIRLIEENYSDSSLNVEKLVHISDVSRTVFYNKIKGLTGLTPVEFLRQMRLNIAAQFLVSSDYNINEIAYMTGFNDVKYFRRCFKSYFGMSPGEYKKIKEDVSPPSFLQE
ncbi:MAG: response regulator [Bacteroidales bacterium]|nr:MAG: response regulator [Bacteroidales bacterium]